MQFQTPLVRARLVRRYKRFLTDMVLENGTETAAHCPNPGAMTGLAAPGACCWLERAAAGRKLPFGWRLVELPGEHMACIDTTIPNRIAAEALAGATLPALGPLHDIRPETRLGPGTRIDFAARDAEGAAVLIEVKSVTLSRDGWAEFPDTVTARGTRHLHELARAAQDGARAVMLYVASRSDARRLRIAGDIDPAYARAFADARAAGVEALGLACTIGVHAIAPAGPLPVDPTPRAP